MIATPVSSGTGINNESGSLIIAQTPLPVRSAVAGGESVRLLNLPPVTIIALYRTGVRRCPRKLDVSAWGRAQSSNSEVTA
jgi:hypothetical protein